MLLDLAAAHAEGRQVSISSLCHASGVPATTALRWIMTLEEAGLVQREADHADRRRSFVALTAKADDCMTRYLTTIGGKRTR